MNSGYSRAAVCATQTCNFVKTNSIIDVSFFATFPFVLKNQITRKITCQPGVKLPPFALTAPKHEKSARKEAQKQNINT